MQQSCLQGVDRTIGCEKEFGVTSKKAAESERIKFGQHRQSAHRRLYEESGRVSEDRSREWDTPVGSLVVSKGRIIAEGFEAVKKHMDISGHAELIVIRNACSELQTLDLSGCTLYSTAEPCFMCSYAIRQTRISKVIIGGRASKAGGISSQHPILTDAQIAGWGEPPDIVAGLLEAEGFALGA